MYDKLESLEWNQLFNFSLHIEKPAPAKKNHAAMRTGRSLRLGRPSGHCVLLWCHTIVGVTVSAWSRSRCCGFRGIVHIGVGLGGAAVASVASAVSAMGLGRYGCVAEGLMPNHLLQH